MKEELLKAYRFRIYPTPAQETAFRRISGCCRLVYNWGLEARKTRYAALPRDAEGKAIGFGLSKQDQCKSLVYLKAEKPFLEEAPSHTLQAALWDLDNAYQRFFSGDAEYPVFRKKSDGDRFRFPDKTQFSLRQEQDVAPKSLLHERQLAAEKKAWEKRKRSKAGKFSREPEPVLRRPRLPRRGMQWLLAPKFGMTGVDGGAIAVRVHRRVEGEIRSCTISRDGSRWFASFTVAVDVTDEQVTGNALVERLVLVGEVAAITPAKSKEKTVKTAKSKVEKKQAAAERRRRRAAARKTKVVLDPAQARRTRITGIDWNVRRPIVTSDGGFYGEAALTPKEAAKLKRLQQSFARKAEALRKAHGRAPGSSLKGLPLGSNLLRAQRKIATFHARIGRKRKDRIHKITAEMVRSAEIFVLEDLKLTNLTASAAGTLEEPGRNVAQKSGLNRSFLDKGHYEFQRQLEYKCRFANRISGYCKAVIRVNPAYTSRTCFACGHEQSENRAAERFVCLGCGHENHADVNAAKNIRQRGLDVLASAYGLETHDLAAMVAPSRPGGTRPLHPKGSAIRLPMKDEICSPAGRTSVRAA